MLVTTQAIVLSKLKYRDNDLIVKCYTQQLGIVSFLLRGVLKSKKGGARTAYFQLLSQLQLTLNYKDNRSLQTLTDVRLNHLYSSLHTHVLKSAIVMFLSEVLSSGLREVESQWIGERVMDELRQLDGVAYIRFASVYRSFNDIDEFVETINLMEKKAATSKS